LNKDAIIELAINMLKMSRKCKRKNKKMGTLIEENVAVEDIHANQKPKTKPHQ